MYIISLEMRQAEISNAALLKQSQSHCAHQIDLRPGLLKHPLIDFP